MLISIGVPRIGAHDDRFDLGQRFDEKRVERAHGIGKEKHRAKIERIDAALGGPHLTRGAPDCLPGRGALERARRVQNIGTFGAGRAAGRAIAVAPAEMPFGESDQTFFSSACKRIGAT